MSDIKKTSAIRPPQPANKLSSNPRSVSKQLEKDADEMAGRAGTVENKYDENHEIFTK